MPPSPAFYTPSLFTSFLNSRVLFLVFCASKNTKLFTVHMLYLGLNVSDQLKNSFFPSLYAFEHPHNHNHAQNLSLSRHTLTRTQTHLYVHPPRRSKSTHRASAFFYFAIFKKWRDNPTVIWPQPWTFVTLNKTLLLLLATVLFILNKLYFFAAGHRAYFPCSVKTI